MRITREEMDKADTAPMHIVAGTGDADRIRSHRSLALRKYLTIMMNDGANNAAHMEQEWEGGGKPLDF